MIRLYAPSLLPSGRVVPRGVYEEAGGPEPAIRVRIGTFRRHREKWPGAIDETTILLTKYDRWERIPEDQPEN